MKSSRRNRLGLNLSEAVLILTQFSVLVYATAFENLLLRRPPSDPGEVQLLLRGCHGRLCRDGNFEERVFDETAQPEEQDEEEEEENGEDLSLTDDDPEGGGFERRARKVKDSDRIRYLIQLGHMIGTDVDTKTHRLYVGKRRTRPEEQQQEGPQPSRAEVHGGRQRQAGTPPLRRLDLGSPWRWAFLPRVRVQP